MAKCLGMGNERNSPLRGIVGAKTMALRASPHRVALHVED